MKKWMPVAGLLWTLLILSLLLAAPARAENPFLTAASIGPLADFTAQVGGDRVKVITLVPPGASPHTYEPTPFQVSQVARARLLVLNGAGLEFWAQKLIHAADNPRLEVVYTSRGIPLIDEGPHGANPHVWLDVSLAMVQVARIRDALVRADPAHAGSYRRNAAAYLERLRRLDAEIAARVRTWKQRQFIAFHPAWVYFARRYGLREVAVVEKSPGREPSPTDLAGIVEIARRIHARAIFAEPEFSSKAAEIVARESGARVVFLDPLGSTPPKYLSYIGMMRYNVAQMASVLR